jgi:hypothetical protein
MGESERAWNKENFQRFICNLIPNKVEVDFHMLCSSMKNWIDRQYAAAMLSHYSFGVEAREIPSSRSSALIQSSSAVVLATDLYLASVEDWETVGCF